MASCAKGSLVGWKRLCGGRLTKPRGVHLIPYASKAKGRADSANLAACHGCCLVPETSCEEGNRLLDRALLIGTPENPAMGLFSSLL